jgi:hypothetical protein
LKGFSNVKSFFEILIGIANALGCSHIISVRGFECLT